MYKITMGDKTMVGSNYDAYYLNLRIWFEKAGKIGEYGAAYTGGRIDEHNNYAPQSGLNECGLTFSRLAAAPPENTLLAKPDKKIISNPTLYLKDILHKCKSIDEVQLYINQYDQSFFAEDVFIYIEKSGRYLIVEPDTMTIGNDAKYVLANFCPTRVTDFNSIKQPRYRDGVTFLSNKMDTTISFCTALSDTMHVCRKKMGDGTLLTIIRDLNKGNIYLNFYHDFNHQRMFNLKAELSKGNHFYDVRTLFPRNAEFEKLNSYLIPQNSNSVLLFMFVLAGVFFVSALYFITSFVKNYRDAKYSFIKFGLFLMGIFMTYYVLILTRNENVFFFPAPYKDYQFSLLTIASYLPYLILLLIIPSFLLNKKVIKEKSWSLFSKVLYSIINFSFVILIIVFGYWGFYNVII